MLLYSYDGDGWWPRLSPDGRYVAFGGGGIPRAGIPPTVRVYDLHTRQLHTLGTGRAIAWIGSDRVAFVREVGRDRDERWECTIGAAPVRTADDPALVAANDFDASSGHWASWLHVAGDRLVYDGRVLLLGARGVEMRGRYLLTISEDREFVVLHDGVEIARRPLPPRANSWAISDLGWIGYGYFWDARILTPSGRDRDVTVTPWRREGVPRLVHLPTETWIWTHTERPSDERSFVLGRPLTDSAMTAETPCVVLDDFPAIALDAVWTGREFVIAGCGPTGILTVHRVQADAPRVLVRDMGTPPPPPPPPPPPGEHMAAPNRFDVVQQLAAMLRPELSDAVAGARFTAQLAATLHFGSSSLGISPDANWGRRRNPSGVLSNDVLAYRATGETFDICTAMGASNARIGWAPSTPGEWVQPDRADVVAGHGEPPPPPPTDTAIQIRDALFDIRDLLRRAASRFGL